MGPTWQTLFSAANFTLRLFRMTVTSVKGNDIYCLRLALKYVQNVAHHVETESCTSFVYVGFPSNRCHSLPIEVMNSGIAALL